MERTDLYKRLIRILSIILALSVLLFYGTFLFPYLDFYYNSKPEFLAVTPFSKVIPQGIEYLEDENCFLISGYTFPKGYSEIIVVDKDKKHHVKQIVNEKGDYFKWHSGGIAAHGDFVYVTGGNKKCYVLDKEDLLDPDNDKIKIIGTIDTDSNSSFCFVYGNNLFIGEYQYLKKFTTSKKHHLVSPSGNLNTAMVFAYPLNEKEKLGVSDKAIFALSIGSTVQGMCMDKSGRMYLSASSARWKDSILYVYDFREVLQTVDTTYEYHGKIIPVYVFEDKALIKKLKVPPNAEGVTSKKNNVYLIFESASARFKYGYLFGTQYVYKINSKEMFD